jgi:short-subunit dehydrogenase
MSCIFLLFSAALVLWLSKLCLLGVSSGMGIVAVPLTGFYYASKWAVEALDESLAQAAKDFGIKVTLIEPAPMPRNLRAPLR